MELDARLQLADKRRAPKKRAIPAPTASIALAADGPRADRVSGRADDDPRPAIVDLFKRQSNAKNALGAFARMDNAGLAL